MIYDECGYEFKVWRNNTIQNTAFIKKLHYTNNSLTSMSQCLKIPLIHYRLIIKLILILI